jgi:isopenicillin-N N-acyltransferase-like protein
MVCPFPYICVEGAPRARGTEYGRRAAAQIGVSLGMYRELFEAYASMTWEQAVRKAGCFEEPIKAYLPDALEEMLGIAEGAGVSYGDILALNCRSELMFALPDGCTSMVIPPEASADGRPYIAQNWDWLAPARESCVVLELHQHPLPAILTICEAGMVGGKGVNSAGIGCGMNALGIGRGQIGTPLHVLFRGVMNSVKISDAIEAVARPGRAGCGNFFMGSAEGFVLHLEFSPDDFDVLMAEEHGLAHANHYLSPVFVGRDKLKSLFTCSYPRLHRARTLLRRFHGKLDRAVVAQILADHGNFPDSPCNHEDPRDATWGRYATIYGFFVDLAARALWVTNGNPCCGEWHPFYLRPGA